ncbi:MAG: phage recombination protein Bet [Vicinamibacterales bacterium]
MAVAEKDLSVNWAKRGVDIGTCRALFNLYPGARPASVLLVFDYCKARNLDPLKKPVHIVPMYVKDANTGHGGMRDVVMPGIYEYRITAHRTGDYLGHTKPVYGPVESFYSKNPKLKDDKRAENKVDAPAWVETTFFRWNRVASQRTEFTVVTFFAEVVARTRDGDINDRWTNAPIQMMTKCNEAAGLREAFPEEFGGTHTEEEIQGRHFQANDAPASTVIVTSQQPDGYAAFLATVSAAASSGADAASRAFGAGTDAQRAYLSSVDAARWEELRDQAMTVGREQ